GQATTSYVNIMTGPRRPGEGDGPEALHVVIVDNGRSGLLGGKYEAALHCIRCGACMDVCPVYRQVGGHAYGWIVGGPIGSVITPRAGRRSAEGASPEGRIGGLPPGALAHGFAPPLSPGFAAGTAGAGPGETGRPPALGPSASEPLAGRTGAAGAAPPHLQGD